MRHLATHSVAALHAAEVGQIDNWGGLWLGDRTLADPNRTFMPTPSNIVYLPPAREIAREVGGVGGGAPLLFRPSPALSSKPARAPASVQHGATHLWLG